MREVPQATPCACMRMRVCVCSMGPAALASLLLRRAPPRPEAHPTCVSRAKAPRDSSVAVVATSSQNAARNCGIAGLTPHPRARAYSRVRLHRGATTVDSVDSHPQHYHQDARAARAPAGASAEATVVGVRVLGLGPHHGPRPHGVTVLGPLVGKVSRGVRALRSNIEKPIKAPRMGEACASKAPPAAREEGCEQRLQDCSPDDSAPPGWTPDTDWEIAGETPECRLAGAFLGAISDRRPPSSTDFGQSWPDVGRNWPSVGHVWSNLAAGAWMCQTTKKPT